MLIDYAKLTVEQYAALGEKDPALCYLFASGTGGTRNFSSDIPASLLIQREIIIQEHVFATTTNRPKISEKMTTRLWGEVGNAHRAGGVGARTSHKARSDQVWGLLRSMGGCIQDDRWPETKCGCASPASNFDRRVTSQPKEIAIIAS